LNAFKIKNDSAAIKCAKLCHGIRELI
jgi:hypothetical protein